VLLLRRAEARLDVRERPGVGGVRWSAQGFWMERAVGVLKREGEEGEYWRDGRDLQVLWERVEGGDV
jgi:hypothetical protein